MVEKQAATTTMELTVISAEDLKNVNLFSRMDAYAVAWISTDRGARLSRQRTPADRDGARNPSWNTTLRFPIPVGHSAAASLHVLIRSKRLLGDRDVGVVVVPLHEILGGATAGTDISSYQVRSPSSGKAKGVLNLSYKLLLDDVAAPAAAIPPPPPPSTYNEPVTAYPAAVYQHPAYAAAPPAYPPPAYGMYGQQGAWPPAAAAPWYPPQSGAGGLYPPAAAPRNNFGIGVGAGLLGGALGGLLIGDMISDAGGF